MPKPATARLVFAALAAVVLLAACGGDGVPAPATPTPSRRPTLPATPTASPSPVLKPVPEVLRGIDVTDLVFTDSVELPSDLALIIETGCIQCDGPTTGFARVYRDTGGRVLTETILTVDSLGLPPHQGQGNQHYITGFAERDDASEIDVTVCTSGYCGGLGWPTLDAREALFRSADGGITWRLITEDAGGHALGILSAGQVLLGRYREQGTRYFTFLGKQALDPPVAGAWPRVALNGEVFWNMSDGRIMARDGSVVFRPDGDGTTVSADGPEIAPDGKRYVSIGSPLIPPSHYFMVEIDGAGRPLRAFRLPGYPAVGPWLVKQPSFFGNAFLPPDQVVSTPTPGPSQYVPVVFDLEDGTMTGIPDAVVQPFGRNHVVAVQHGPFARVMVPGSCLNIRAAPSLDSDVLTCAADGVLLRDQGESAEGDGVAWARVTTPAGTDGWAATMYLER